MNMNMNVSNILEVASDGGMSTRTAAAVGGGAAGGVILLLSLLALCCCWGRLFSERKHSKVHLHYVCPVDNSYRGDSITYVMSETI